MNGNKEIIYWICVAGMAATTIINICCAVRYYRIRKALLLAAAEVNRLISDLTKEMNHIDRA